MHKPPQNLSEIHWTETVDPQFPNKVREKRDKREKSLRLHDKRDDISAYVARPLASLRPRISNLL
jgi:hypothetical protein